MSLYKTFLPLISLVLLTTSQGQTAMSPEEYAFQHHMRKKAKQDKDKNGVKVYLDVENLKTRKLTGAIKLTLPDGTTKDVYINRARYTTYVTNYPVKKGHAFKYAFAYGLWRKVSVTGTCTVKTLPKNAAAISLKLLSHKENFPAMSKKQWQDNKAALREEGKTGNRYSCTVEVQ